MLVRPAEVDDTIAEALNRMRGELVAEGFDVSEVGTLPQPPPLPGGAEGPAADATLATIDLSVEEGADIVDLRVIDQLTNKTVIRRTPVERGASSHTAEVLAVRAVELLRASLLELLLESRPSEPAVRAPNAEATHASKWAAQGLPREREPVWGVEAGATVLADFGGIPPAVLGLARLRRTVFGPLALRATVAGLGTRPRVQSGNLGSATVSQDIGLLECVASLWEGAIVHPVLSIGAGALYTSVDGHASYPYQARSGPTSAWAAAADGSVGLEVRLGRHFSFSEMANHRCSGLPRSAGGCNARLWRSARLPSGARAGREPHAAARGGSGRERHRMRRGGRVCGVRGVRAGPLERDRPGAGRAHERSGRSLHV